MRVASCQLTLSWTTLPYCLGLLPVSSLISNSSTHARLVNTTKERDEPACRATLVVALLSPQTFLLNAAIEVDPGSYYLLLPRPTSGLSGMRVGNLNCSLYSNCSAHLNWGWHSFVNDFTLYSVKRSNTTYLIAKFGRFTQTKVFPWQLNCNRLQYRGQHSSFRRAFVSWPCSVTQQVREIRATLIGNTVLGNMVSNAYSTAPRRGWDSAGGSLPLRKFVLWEHAPGDDRI